MSELKCPFCQQELTKYYWDDLECYVCPDLTCDGYYMSATKDMWQELIRTRKALDVAVDALNKCHETFTESEALIVANKHNRIANRAIAEITALEQKDIK